MMSCNEARALLDAFLDGETGAAEAKAVQDHLESCLPCAREADERRAFSESIAESMDRALDGAEPAAEERERLVARMAAASRRRSLLPAQLAAAAVVGLAVGLVAHALGLFGGAGREGMEEAERRIRSVEEEAARELALVRASVPDALATAPPLRVADLQAAALEESRAPSPAPRKAVAELVADTASPDPRTRGTAYRGLKELGAEKLEDLRRAAEAVSKYDRTFVQEAVERLEDRALDGRSPVISFSHSSNGATVEFRQMSDGRVHLTVNGKPYEARSMAELLSRHGDVCREMRVEGRDGAVRLDGKLVGRDFEGQLDLAFRTGAWDSGVWWDAYRAWVAGRVPDAAEVEKRVRDLQERCAEAAPRAPLDLDALFRNLKGIDPAQLARLRDRLKEAQDLRARAHSLRVFTEKVREEK